MALANLNDIVLEDVSKSKTISYVKKYIQATRFNIVTTDQKNICNGKVKTRHKEGYNVFSEEACENLPTSKETYLVCTVFIDI